MACTQRVAPIATKESNVSRRSKRFGDRLNSAERCRPRESASGVFHGHLRRLPSDTPVASLARSVHFPLSRRCTMRPGQPDRFYFGAVTLTEAFAIRGAFPRRVIHVSCDPLQIEAVNHRRSRDFAHRAPDYRLLFTPGIPHNACGIAKLPLVRTGAPQKRCVLSRGLSTVG